MEKLNAVSVSSSTKNYSIYMDKTYEKQKEVEHFEDGVDETPQLYESEELEEDLKDESNEKLEEDPDEDSSEELEDEPSEEPVDCPKEKLCMEQCQSPLDRNNSRTEDPLEVCLSKERDTDKSEYLSSPIANSSNEKKRTLHMTAVESTPLQDCQLWKKYRQDKSPELKAECSSAISDPHVKSGLSVEHKYECASEQQEKSGSSGKRRRSRLDLQPERDGKTGEDDRTSKRRKTRWTTDVSQSKLLGPLQLPDFRKECVLDYELDSEFQELKAKIVEINQILQNPELQDDRLVNERQCIISKMIKKISTFKHTNDMPSTFFKKLYIPVNEYPGYNFIGLIMGPRGNTHKMMEKETGAKILLRGKVCTVTPQKPSSVSEDLHVRIEADNQKSLYAAVAMVGKLLIPAEEGKNPHKRAQLKELARLNGTLRKEMACEECGEQGHRRYACLDQRCTFETTVLAASCPLTSSSPLSSSLQGSSNTKIKPSKEIDEATLYVAYLPSHVDDLRLKELFCPFGKVTEAKVIKDRMTGISKGYGFVKFENASNAAVAIAHLNEYKMDGKMLAVRVAGRQSVADFQVNSPLPQYPGPPTVLPNAKSQGTCPGPSGLLVPEQASCPGTDFRTMLSSSIYSGHKDLLGHFDTSAGSSQYHFSNNMVFSSPTSAALFPSNPDYQSCFTTPTTRPSALYLCQTPWSELDSTSWQVLPVHQEGYQ